MNVIHVLYGRVCEMLELYPPQYKKINTKERITIDLIRDGQEFLQEFDINTEYLLDTISVVYKYLRNNGKIPHNLFKFFIELIKNKKYLNLLLRYQMQRS